MISGNYKELTRDQALEYSPGLDNAWRDPSIPKKQFELAVKPELKRYREGAPCAPFSALVEALLELPPEIDKPETSFMEVGASSGYYNEVLKIAGFKYTYEASDYSEHFKTLAAEIYPHLKFQIANALKLPWADGSFDILMSGCVMIHVLDYEQIIKEAARVAKKYVIFHRTPVNITDRPMRYFIKEAYGVPCLEFHYREGDLMKAFLRHGLRMVTIKNVFEDKSHDLAHRVYVLEKRG